MDKFHLVLSISPLYRDSYTGNNLTAMYHRFVTRVRRLDNELSVG
jgi:hypothetical protein